MPDIHVTLLGRFAVTVGGAPVAEASWKDAERCRRTLGAIARDLAGR